MFGRSNKSGGERHRVLQVEEEQFAQEPGAERGRAGRFRGGVGTPLGGPAPSLSASLLLGAFWALFVQFCCLSSSLPLSLPCLGFSPLPDARPAWGSLPPAGSMSPCVCERGAREPWLSLWTWSTLGQDPTVRTRCTLGLGSWRRGGGQRRLEREVVTGVRGQCRPGASASPAAIRVRA